MITHTQSWVSMIRKAARLVAVLSCVALVLGSFAPVADAATGVPRIMNYQGRLMNSSGTLLGGSGTDYCIRFSLYDNATVGSGSRLWPSAATSSTMTVVVRNGVFNAGVGDTNAGGDTLDFNFEDTDAAYLNVEVATKVGATCAPGDGAESFENLSPRQRVTSSGYAINSATLGGRTGAYYLANSFSTSSAAAFAQASSTIAKTYANNTFIGINAFADITVTNATIASSTLTNATSTNLNVGGTFSGAGLSSCSGSNDKLVWDASTRQFACAADLTGGGSGGADGNWTFFNNTGIRPATTTNQVLVGGTATTSLAKFEVQGGAKFDNATSTTLNTTVLGLGGSEYFTSLAGTGLQNVGGILTLNTLGDWTGTFDGREGSYYLANSFSTSSAAYFASAGLAFSTSSAQYFASQNPGTSFSTSSADYWKNQNNFHSTSSFAYDLSTYDKGFFFSTTSVAHWDSTQFRWATTSTDAWFAAKSTDDLDEGISNKYYATNLFAADLAATTTDALAEGAANFYFTGNRFAGALAGTTTDALAEGTDNKYFTAGNADTYLNGKDKGYFFSTTSAVYFNSQNPGASFSTTSADFWKTQRNFHSTSSFAFDLSTYDTGYFFSTTSVAYWNSTQFRWATTSSDAWLATKSTSDLAEGSNLYYTPSRVAGVIAGTTTDALAEGGVNKYFTPNRVATVIAGTTTDALPEGGTNKYFTNGNADTYLDGKDKGYFFSTTSALYFSAQNPGSSFATTSADYWKTQNNFHSTSSFAYDLGTYDTGYFFSTTSVAYWDSTQFRWATTSSDAWLATKSTSDVAEGSNLYYTPTRVAGVIAGTTTDALAEGSVNQYYTPARDIRFSTTSALFFSANGLAFSTSTTDYWKSVNNFFSTTSASHFSSLGLAFSTSSASYFLNQNLGAAFSTSSTDYYMQTSSTVPTAYKNNSFTGTNSFQNVSATGVTSTASFATTASSSNLFSSVANIGSLVVSAFTGNVVTATNATTTNLYAQFASTTQINSNTASVGSAAVGSLSLGNALSGTNGGTGLSSVVQNALLIGGPGNSWTQVSTSSLGLATYGDLGAYLGLAAWYATTTDALAEGNNNKYFTPNRVATVLAGTTTDAIAEGVTNKYFTPGNADTYLNGKDKGYFFSTTSASSFAAAGLAFSTTSAAYFNSVNPGASFSTTSADYYKSQNNFHSTSSFAYDLSTYDSGYFFSTTSVAYWDSTQFRWATTSSDAWLATKSTSNLAEGSNLYYTPSRVAGVIAGTTTDALAEGSVNQYYTPTRDIRFSTSSALFFSANGLSFSTTSTDYYRLQNNFFSTTSASHFTSLGLAFSTTSTAYFLTQNQGAAFSTTSANHFVNSSTTIPKTYTANTFTALNSFDDITAADATTSSLFSRISSSVNAFFGQFSATSTTATSTINGALGIGISNPNYKVSVLGSVTGPTSATGTAVFAISNDNNTLSSANNVLRLNIRTPYGTACVTGTTCPRFEEYFTGVGSGSDTGGRAVGSLRLSTAGTGITQTSGAADFAEFMQLSESASVGDLVSLNSSGQYKKAVAGESIIGVVSDNAAFVGNGALEGQANAYVVGFAGVIKTTVSTANGPINAGDLIAASDVPGVGVKLSESGYALGQALESYSGVGNGTIGVLVLPKFVDASIALASYGGGASGDSGYWTLSTSTNTVSLASSTNSVEIGGNASTSNLVVSNGFTFGKATGVLKSIAGVVSSSFVNLASEVSGVLGISNGGTGTSTAPTSGQVLVGNSSGGYDLVAAASLVAQNQGNTFSTTSAAYNLSTYDKGFFFSTTSSNFWKTQNNFFSTSSTDFWKTQNNFFSTTSASNFSALGLAFSTSSASAFLGLNQGAAFSTSSASAFLAQNQGNAFSTTSASNFAAAGLAFSTTSAAYYQSQNPGAAYSTTSENYYQQTSSTVVTSYKNNTFTGTNGFQNITAIGATTSVISTGIASTSNLTISNIQNSMLYTGPGGVVTGATISGPLSFSAGTLSIQTASGSQAGALAAADFNSFNSRLSTSSLNTIDKGQFFSTTSASVFAAAGLAFSTTSTDYWKSVNNFFSTTSASHFSSLGLGFSTSSASAFLALNQGAAFSTSSASAFLAQNQGNAFSTTSASNFAAAGLAFSTTSAAYYQSQNPGAAYSTTSENYYQQTSSTVVTSYKNNTFTGTNGFQNITAIGATTTSLSAGIASTSNLTISNIQNSMLYTGPGGIVTGATISGPLSFSAGTLSIQTASASQTGALSSSDFNSFNSRLSTSSLATIDKGFFFSTTSSDFWKTQNNFFSTSSTDFWKTQNNFFSTTSASNFSALGLAFSTSSASAFLSVNQGAAFSTTSASAFLAQNQGNAFSTTSASNFAAAGLAFSTTSASYHLSQNQGAAYSTTSENFYQQSSSTVVTSYKNNTFTGTNGFQNITATGATTTSLSTGTASTTNLTISALQNSMLYTGPGGIVQGVTVSGPLSFSAGSLSIQAASATQAGALSSADWNAFNSRISTSTLSLFDKGYFYSTTSAQFFSSVGLGFSTSSADAYVVASSSIPKTYTTNTFIGINNFANITATGATTTSFFTGTASSTNIFANTARFGSLGAFSLTGSVAAAANSITGLSIASTTDLWISNIRNGLLATNAQGNVVASSTPTASSFNATSNTASQLPYASTTAISALQQLSIGAANGTILQGAAAGTSTLAGVINVTGTNSTSTFSGGVSVSQLNITGASTSTAAWGMSIKNGCFAINGVCTLASVTASTSAITVTTGNGTAAIALNLANPNVWSGLQQFGNASSSLMETTQFYARTIQSTSTNALILQSNFSSTAGLTFGSTSTPNTLVIDTISNKVRIGTQAGATPSLLVLDSKNTVGDPTTGGIAGAQYFNAFTNEYRCFVTSWITCGGQAASSTGNVQYRNVDGSFTANAGFTWSIPSAGLVLTGASSTQTTDLLTIASSTGRSMFSVNGMGVSTFASTSDPVAPPSGELNIYAKEIAGRMLPKWVGPAGIDTPFQANLGFNKVVLVSSAGAALTAVGATIGNNTATLTAGALSTASLKQSVRRTTVTTSVTTAGTVASSRSTTALVTRGNAAGIGGFFYTIRFGLTTLQAGNRGFFGLSDVVTAPTNVDPTTNTTPGKVGLAFALNSGNWKFVQNITGTAPAVIDLGASFPINTTDLLELIMYAKPNDTTINYRITNLTTGAQISSSTGSTNIPSNTTYLTAVEWMTNNATTGNVAFDFSALYLESDN